MLESSKTQSKIQKERIFKMKIDMKKLYEDRLEIINRDLKTAAINRKWDRYGKLKDEKKEILLKLDEFKK